MFRGLLNENIAPIGEGLRQVSVAEEEGLGGQPCWERGCLNNGEWLIWYTISATLCLISYT